jgi:hypothetical protein
MRVSRKRVSRKRVSRKRVSKKRVSRKRVSKKRVSRKRVSRKRRRVHRGGTTNSIYETVVKKNNPNKEKKSLLKRVRGLGKYFRKSKTNPPEFNLTSKKSTELWDQNHQSNPKQLSSPIYNTIPNNMSQIEDPYSEYNPVYDKISTNMTPPVPSPRRRSSPSNPTYEAPVPVIHKGQPPPTPPRRRSSPSNPTYEAPVPVIHKGQPPPTPPRRRPSNTNVSSLTSPSVENLDKLKQKTLQTLQPQDLNMSGFRGLQSSSSTNSNQELGDNPIYGEQVPVPVPVSRQENPDLTIGDNTNAPENSLYNEPEHVERQEESQEESLYNHPERNLHNEETYRMAESLKQTLSIKGMGGESNTNVNNESDNENNENNENNDWSDNENNENTEPPQKPPIAPKPTPPTKPPQFSPQRQRLKPTIAPKPTPPTIARKPPIAIKP